MNAYPVFFCRALQKYPLQLDHTDHRGVNFPGIFTRRFSERSNILFPLQRTILQTITFGTILPDKTSKIPRASENLKFVMQAKPFSVFEIILVHDQNSFEGLGWYPQLSTNCFVQLKYNLMLLNVPSAPA